MPHYFSKLDPRVAIMVAALSAGLMAWDAQPAVVLGAGLALSLTAAAAQSSWLGLLAVFPLVFAIRPAPPGIGIQEAVFALLVAVIMLRSLIELGGSEGWRGIVRRYGMPGGIAALLAGVNLAVALSHGVALADWLRGLVPFLFLVLALPLAQSLEGRPERLRWLGLSVGALIVLMAGHVVLYFLWHDLNQPYWLAGEGVSARRIPGALLAAHPGAVGPIYDRITILLPRATDALLPGGLAVAFVVAVRSANRGYSRAAAALAFLSLAAMLMTYTRSMLLAPLGVLGLFVACVAVCWPARLLRSLVLVGGLAIGGVVLVYLLGIEPMWLKRVSGLVQTSDVTVFSRVEELRIAWQKFLDYPLLGNGLGDKHEMRFPVLGVQQVAYIHNWPLYALMAGGVTGFAAYAWVLLLPVFRDWRAIGSEPVAISAVRAGVLTFAVYALAFAVFRLISFNVLLAAAWGVMLANRVRAGKP